MPGTLAGVDVVFPVLHGPYGEDGTIQGLLEMAGVPYVGSGVLASAAAMDKGAMKALFAHAGLEQAPYVVVTDRDWRRDRAGALERRRGARAAGVRQAGARRVEPRHHQGQGRGRPRGRDRGRARARPAGGRRGRRSRVPRDRVRRARRRRRRARRPACCAEIVVHGAHEFYDFEAKYLDDAADLVVPADLPAEVAERVRDAGRAGLRGAALRGPGARATSSSRPDGRVLVNEVNTMPGFTSISMFPRMWAETGVDYPTLVDRLVADALRRGTGLR